MMLYELDVSQNCIEAPARRDDGNRIKAGFSVFFSSRGVRPASYNRTNFNL